MSDKTYVDGLFIKSVNTKYGEILKLNIKVGELEQFLNTHENENGFVSIDLIKRKEPSDKGLTHYAVLNEWKPKSANDSNEQVTTNNAEEPQKDFNEDSDDLPF